VHVADVVDEDEPAARVDVQRGPRHPRRQVALHEQRIQPSSQPSVGRSQPEVLRDVHLADPASLQDDPAEVRRLGGLDGEVVGHVDQPVQDVLDLLRRQRLECFAAPGRHQEEHAPQEGVEVDDLPQQVGQLVHVPGGHRGVDLEPHAELDDVAADRHGGVVHPLDAPEPVVGRGARAVEGDRDGLGACCRGRREACPRGLRRDRGGQRHAQPCCLP
jgi:hypothetical protein